MLISAVPILSGGLMDCGARPNVINISKPNYVYLINIEYIHSKNTLLTDIKTFFAQVQHVKLHT
jgi:hypothetical protein